MTKKTVYFICFSEKGQKLNVLRGIFLYINSKSTVIISLSIIVFSVLLLSLVRACVHAFFKREINQVA